MRFLLTPPSPPCCLGRYLCDLVYDFAAHSCSKGVGRREGGRWPLLARSTAAEDLINFCGSQKIFRLFRLRPNLNFELHFDLHANGVGGEVEVEEGEGRVCPLVASCRHAG